MRDSTTVLVVDDDPSTVSMMRTLFEEHGCRVIVAMNGIEALAALITDGEVDLIVSDIDMPEMDGLEMCRLLEGLGDDTRVILVSGLDVDPADVRGAAPSIAGFLPKPFEVTDLLETAIATIGS